MTIPSGEMQDFPLRVSTIIDHAAKYHADRPIITRTPEGPITKSNWATIRQRALKVSQGLVGLGVNPGDHIGIMAWNTARHMECWYGIPGAAAVTHTLNPRLFADQLIYIINHAEDKMIIVDHDLVPILEKIADSLTTVEQYIVLTDAEHMPETSLKNTLCYEDWLAQQSGDFTWVDGDERDPCGICYTSGTTGNPKGVVYTHRSNVLHAMTVVQSDMMGLSSNDVMMPVVPLFHANGWSTGYSTPLVGAGMVMPGRDMSPAGLFEMLEHGVTITAAVPTIWLLLLQYMETEEKNLSTLNRVVIGGSACPQAVIEKFQNTYGVQVIHAWGMTETSPLGTLCTFKPEVGILPPEEKIAKQLYAGHPPYGVDLQIVDDNDNVLEWNNTDFGRLLVRGPGVVKRYLKQDNLAVDDNNWFDTGDVAIMDPNGYMRITDRSKDVIKSGGEWISSIDLENFAVGAAGVKEAAAVGIVHPKWDERPVIVIVAMEGETPAKQDILDHIGQYVAKWQVPDDVIFMDDIPHTATGKISKLDLRKKINDLGYVHPDLV